MAGSLESLRRRPLLEARWAQLWVPPFPRGMFTNAFWRQRLLSNQHEYKRGQSLRLVLRWLDDPDGPVVGMANFTQFMRGAFMACSLGYSIDQDAQGKGLMREALQPAIDHVFGHMTMHRIMAGYVPTNDRSGRLLRRLGFRVDGYAHDYIFINGAWRDHILTSLLNPNEIHPPYVDRL